MDGLSTTRVGVVSGTAGAATLDRLPAVKGVSWALERHAAGHLNSLSVDAPILVSEKRPGQSSPPHAVDVGILAHHAAAEVGLKELL